MTFSPHGRPSLRTWSRLQPSCLNDHINLINFSYINIVPVTALSIINADAIRMESKTLSASTSPVLQSGWHFKSGFNQMLIRREKVQAGAAANNPTGLRMSGWLITLQHRKCTSEEDDNMCPSPPLTTSIVITWIFIFPMKSIWNILQHVTYHLSSPCLCKTIWSWSDPVKMNLYEYLLLQSPVCIIV